MRCASSRCRLAGRLTHYDFDFGGDLFAGRQVRVVDCGDADAVAGRYEENARNATAAVRAVLERSRWRSSSGATMPPPPRHACRRGAGTRVRGPPRGGARLAGRGERRARGGAERDASRRRAAGGERDDARRPARERRGPPSDVQDARAFGSVLVRAEEVHELGVPGDPAAAAGGAALLREPRRRRPRPGDRARHGDARVRRLNVLRGDEPSQGDRRPRAGDRHGPGRDHAGEGSPRPDEPARDAPRS